MKRKRSAETECYITQKKLKSQELFAGNSSEDGAIQDQVQSDTPEQPQGPALKADLLMSASPQIQVTLNQETCEQKNEMQYSKSLLPLEKTRIHAVKLDKIPMKDNVFCAQHFYEAEQINNNEMQDNSTAFDFASWDFDEIACDSVYDSSDSSIKLYYLVSDFSDSDDAFWLHPNDLVTCYMR